MWRRDDSLGVLDEGSEFIVGFAKIGVGADGQFERAGGFFAVEAGARSVGGFRGVCIPRVRMEHAVDAVFHRTIARVE